MIGLLIAAAAQLAAFPLADEDIIVTASRLPQNINNSAASATVLDQERIERLGEPLIAVLLRLTPSAAITIQGPAGLLTEVRIRGAENNHTLLFIDGIRANDPATGDFARFELLNADLASRIEIVRGPQSALWGSQAIGGVVAIDGADAPQAPRGSLEAGSLGTLRASASAGGGTNNAELNGAVGWQRARGIDSFAGGIGGDRDGYRNFSGRLRGTFDASPDIRLGASTFVLTGRSEFDGYSPLTFERTDTQDESRNRLAAGRIWADYRDAAAPWSATVSASLLGSSNRNLLAGDPVNRTHGSRRTLSAQGAHRFQTGAIAHTVILAADSEHETFKARGIVSGFDTAQDRDRDHLALTGEWRAAGGPLSADIALRRDAFNRFKDATSLRAGAVASVGRGLSLSASYAEGIAQPTFFDLYGFFPNNFVGNPDLKTEKSRGGELSVRFRSDRLTASFTGFRQRLRDEIVDTFDPITFLSGAANSVRVSRRSGIEAEAMWQISPALRLSGHYAFLRALQADRDTGAPSRELRRPPHSASFAADGGHGRWNYGASLAFVGRRRDREEIFPFGVVTLGSYWLASARASYAVRPSAAVFVRLNNLFDGDYEDSAGYRTEGRAIFAGITLAGRQSSR